MQYAAEDAQVGIHILLCLMNKMWTTSSFWPPIRSRDWEAATLEGIQQLCFPFSEIKFNERPGSEIIINSSN